MENHLLMEESTEESSRTHKNVRPWVRYWARFMDYAVFSFIVGLFAPSFAQIPNQFVQSMIIIFIWIFVESILLSSWGRTPGKWLLRTSVKDISGKKPSFPQALKRSFLVWIMGMGLGLPIIPLFTLLAGYNKLNSDGITIWDRKVGTIVEHSKIGVIRTIITIIFFVSIFAFNIYTQYNKIVNVNG